MLAAATAHADPAKPPHGATRISIAYTQSSPHDERRYTLVWNGTRYAFKGGSLDGALVDALYASLIDTRVATAPLSCRAHVAHDPAFAITIEGAEPLTLTSHSDCHAHVPWMLDEGGKLYAQFSGDAWRGIEPILNGLGWPDTTIDNALAGELILLGAYVRGKPSDRNAEACAHSIERDATMRRLFGPITVDELELRCDVHNGKSCNSAAANASFVVDGLDAEMDFICSDGDASLAQSAQQEYGELKRFIASEPVRALVNSSHERLQLSRDGDRGTWTVDPPAGTRAASITWDPEKDAIEIVNWR